MFNLTKYAIVVLLLAIVPYFQDQTSVALSQENNKPKPEIVKFTFRWPLNIVADVEQTETYERNIRDKFHRINIITRYEITIEKDREGYLIKPSMPLSVRVAEYPPDTTLSSLILSTGTAIPSFFVDDRGAFIGIADIRSYWAMIDSIIAHRVKDSTQVARLRVLYDSLYPPSSLRDIAAETWNRMVGYWCQDVVPVGTKIDEMVDISSRYAAGKKLSTNFRYSIAKLPQCTTAFDTGMCVDINCQIIRDPVSYRVWFNRFYRRVGELTNDPDFASITFLNFDSRDDLHLNIDPSTMLASKVYARESTRGDVIIENRKFDFSSRLETTMKIIYHRTYLSR